MYLSSLCQCNFPLFESFHTSELLRSFHSASLGDSNTEIHTCHAGARNTVSAVVLSFPACGSRRLHLHFNDSRFGTNASCSGKDWISPRCLGNPWISRLGIHWQVIAYFPRPELTVRNPNVQKPHIVTELRSCIPCSTPPGLAGIQHLSAVLSCTSGWSVQRPQLS